MPALTRRGAMGLGFGAAMVAAFPALAQGKPTEAMLMNCIDPRVTTTSLAYMVSRGFQDKYSQFVFAGGPIGAVAPAFEQWHKTFWENLAITIQLHSIKRVVGLTHRDWPSRPKSTSAIPPSRSTSASCRSTGSWKS